MSTEQLILALILGVLIAAVLILFFLPLPARRSRTLGNPLADRVTLPMSWTAMMSDDERYWLGGIIYNNPDDPDLIVPKRFGYGRTVNFGRPLGKVLLIGPLLLPVALGILGILFPGPSPRSGATRPAAACCHEMGKVTPSPARGRGGWG